jgi:hypothetical protein
VTVFQDTGLSRTSQDYIVTMAESAPAIAPVADQTVSHTAYPLGVPLTVSDADTQTGFAVKDPLTLTAAIEPNDPLYDLQLQYQLSYTGITNTWLQNEKWFISPSGWYYALLPSGELREYVGNDGTFLKSTVSITTLDPSYWQNPSLFTAALAEVLQAKYQLTFAGNVFTNGWKLNEKWFQAPSGAYFAILPTGELRQFNPAKVVSGNLTASSTSVALLDPSYWRDPSKLVSAAQQPVPATYSYNAATGILTLTPRAGFAGSFQVQVTADDGLGSSVSKTKTTFKVTVDPNAPAITPVADQTTTTTAPPLHLKVVFSDADGDKVTPTFQALPANDPAYDLEVQYGLTYIGATRRDNFLGLAEKWFSDAQGNLYAILPTGEVYQYFGVTTSLNASTQAIANYFNQKSYPIALLDPKVYYNDPTKIEKAVNDAPQVTFSYDSTTDLLTIPAPLNPTSSATPTQPFIGTFRVKIAATDGGLTTTETFNVTVS